MVIKCNCGKFFLRIVEWPSPKVRDKKAMIKIEMFLIIKIMKNSISVWDKRKIAFFYTSGIIAFCCRKAKTHIETLFQERRFYSFIFLFFTLFCNFCRKKKFDWKPLKICSLKGIMEYCARILLWNQEKLVCWNSL